MMRASLEDEAWHIRSAGLQAYYQSLLAETTHGSGHHLISRLRCRLERMTAEQERVRGDFADFETLSLEVPQFLIEKGKGSETSEREDGWLS